jgi:hypothetical protein
MQKSANLIAIRQVLTQPTDIGLNKPGFVEPLFKVPGGSAVVKVLR